MFVFKGDVKLVADTLGIITQCMKWKNVDRTPQGYYYNIILKVNAKLGGTNHTLTSRYPNERPPTSSGQVFQDPPASLSWVFDTPCMMVGMDVSHAENGANSDSVAAIVASMDGASLSLSLSIYIYIYLYLYLCLFLSSTHTHAHTYIHTYI